MWSVRRQVFWHQWRLKLRVSSAHLVGFIMRRVSSVRGFLCSRMTLSRSKSTLDGATLLRLVIVVVEEGAAGAVGS